MTQINFASNAPYVFGGPLPTIPSAGCKHYFPMTETSGTTITDTVGGCVWNVTNNGNSGGLLTFNTLNGANAIGNNMHSNQAPIPLTSGAWFTPDNTKTIMGVYAGRVVYTSADGSYGLRVSMGDVNNLTGLYATPAGFGMSDGVWHGAIGVGGVSSNNNGWLCDTSVTPPNAIGGQNTPVLNAGQTYLGRDVVAIWYVKNGGSAFSNPSGVSVYELYDLATGNLILFAWSAESSNYLTGSFTINPCFRFANLQLYGYAVFQFASDISAVFRQASLYMAQNWKAGNKNAWCPQFYMKS